MSVVAVVKPGGLFGRKFRLKYILTWELGYGIVDEYYRLMPDECGYYTMIYESSYLARGIEVSFQYRNASFKLLFPNFPREIELFYMTVAITCKLLFYRHDEMAELSNLFKLILTRAETHSSQRRIWLGRMSIKM